VVVHTNVLPALNALTTTHVLLPAGNSQNSNSGELHPAAVAVNVTGTPASWGDATLGVIVAEVQKLIVSE
jgi:hypothetical protein